MGKVGKFVMFIVLCFGFVGCSSVGHKGNNDLNNSEYTFIRGINLYQKGQRSDALKEYEKAYKKDPNNTILLKEMGILYSEFDNVDKAVEFFLKAYKKDKNDVDTIKNLAYLYYLKGNYEESLKYINTVPNGDSDIHVAKLKGYIANKKGNFPEAEKYLLSVTENAYDRRYYEQLIEVETKLNKQDELLSLMAQRYDRFSNERYFVLQYAKLTNDIGHNNNDPSDIILRYISQYGGDDELYLELTRSYLASGKYKKAKNSFALISDGYKYSEEYKKINDTIANKTS